MLIWLAAVLIWLAIEWMWLVVGGCVDDVAVGCVVDMFVSVNGGEPCTCSSVLSISVRVLSPASSCRSLDI